jgi:hypothetical protein
MTKYEDNRPDPPRSQTSYLDQPSVILQQLAQASRASSRTGPVEGAGDPSKTAKLERLCALLVLQRGTADAYAATAPRTKNRRLHEKLLELRDDHERHAYRVGDLVSAFGGERSLRADPRDFARHGLVAITDEMDDIEALRAIHGNEVVTARACQRARDEDWTTSVRAFLRGIYEDELRHLATIELILRDAAGLFPRRDERRGSRSEPR